MAQPRQNFQNLKEKGRVSFFRSGEEKINEKNEQWAWEEVVFLQLEGFVNKSFRGASAIDRKAVSSLL